MVRIWYVQCSYLERKDQTLECVARLAPYVEKIVIVVPEPAEDWPELAKYDNVMHIQEEWKDNLPDYNNVALAPCPSNSWVLYTDPDELVCEEFAKNIWEIARKADEQGLTVLCLNAHDKMTKQDGSIDASVSTAYKCIFFKNVQGTHFEGIGETKNLHQSIVFQNARSFRLPPKYYYTHTKKEIEVWERTFRNVFIGGGGNCVGTKNPLWESLRSIAGALELKSWPEMRAYLRKGNVDPRLFDWIKGCRTRGGYDFEDENRGCYIYYRMLHQEELPEEAQAPQLVPGSREEVMHFVEELFLKILGRNADTPSKEAYTQQILEGKLKRENLESILKLSPETWSGLILPAKDVRKAILQSKWYWEEFKPRSDLGASIEGLIPLEKREEFWLEFHTKKPKGKDLFDLIGRFANG